METGTGTEIKTAGKNARQSRMALMGVGLWLAVGAFLLFGPWERSTPSLVVAALCVVNALVHYLRYRKMHTQ